MNDETKQREYLDELLDLALDVAMDYHQSRTDELRAALDIDILGIGLAQREAQMRLELMAEDPKAAAWKIDNLLTEKQREDERWNYLQIKINLRTAEYNEARADREMDEMTYSAFKARLYAERGSR